MYTDITWRPGGASDGSSTDGNAMSRYGSLETSPSFGLENLLFS